MRVGVAVRSDVDLDAAILGMRIDPTLRIRAGDELRVLALTGGVTRDLVLDLDALRWGRRTVGPARVQGLSAGLLLGSDAVTSGPAHLRVLPGVENYRSGAPLPYAVIASGTHVSAFRGEGTDLAGVRPFVRGRPAPPSELEGVAAARRAPRGRVVSRAGERDRRRARLGSGRRRAQRIHVSEQPRRRGARRCRAGAPSPGPR